MQEWKEKLEVEKKKKPTENERKEQTLGETDRELFVICYIKHWRRFVNRFKQKNT